MKHSVIVAAILLAWVSGIEGQTSVDLRSQSRNVDFSAISPTLPMQVGTTLPGTCATGQMFFKSNAPSGSNLYGCTANIWTLEASGGGGGGASSASQLADFAVSRTSATLLTIGAQCSSATPCNVRFGSLTYSILSSGAVSISAGTGMAFIYISSSGVLTVGNDVTASCNTSCVAPSGVTSFPPDSIPLFTWSATSETWDVNGGIDQRGFLSTSNVVPGNGLLSVAGSGATNLSVDTTVTGQRTTVPATSASTCAVGSWSANTSYYFVCVSQNTWLRVALSSW